MPIRLVISGGQTGADQAGWRAAKRFSIRTEGWMPRGFKTEEGPKPGFVALYGAREHGSSAYPPRTRANIEWADATVIFDRNPGPSDTKSRGTRLALDIAAEAGKPCVTIHADPALVTDESGPRNLAEWLERHQVRVLNVAGNRESSCPGIGRWVEAYLCETFRGLGLQEADR